MLLLVSNSEPVPNEMEKRYDFSPKSSPPRQGSLYFSGGIRTKLGTCSYFVTFEYEYSPYLLIWAATKSTTALAAPNYGKKWK
jgi:hypothetical protein